VLKVIK